jgi:hypothetical protein
LCGGKTVRRKKSAAKILLAVKNNAAAKKARRAKISPSQKIRGLPQRNATAVPSDTCC